MKPQGTETGAAEPGRLEGFTKPLREALAVHEALRKLGFSSEQIFMHENPEPLGDVGILLKHRGKTFRFTVGRLDGGWADEWTRLVALFNEGKFSDDELDRWYESSWIRAHYVELVLMLEAKGIEPPYEAN